MTIETDIKARLDAYSGLSALVGSRNYAGLFPQSVTTPATAYIRVTGSVITTLDKKYAENPRYSIDVIASKEDGGYTKLRQIVEQVKLAMTTSTTFTAVLLSDQDLGYDDTFQVFRAVIDFSIWQQ